MFAYALPALPLAILVLPVYVHVPAFYATTMGMGLSGVGAVLLATRLWDMITDPVIGWACDRWGTRKGWIVAGLPITVLCAWLMLMPPSNVGLLYLLLVGLGLHLGWTIMMVPFNAWGAELASDYNTRTRIAGWREAMGLVGTVMAMALPELVRLWMPAISALTVLAISCLLLMPLSIAVMARLVPTTRRPVQAAPTQKLAFSILWQNRPFRRLIAAYFLNGVANGLPATLFLMFVEHRLQRPDAAGWLLLVYFFCGMAAVPLWMRSAERFEKHRVWCVAMLGTCLVFSVAPFLPAGLAWPFAIMAGLTGLALGADLALPPAMQADVIDIDRLQTGQERAGQYMALWGMATKMALALAVGTAFPLLSLAGFQAEGPMGAAFAQQGLWALAALYGLAPIAFKLAAIALMWHHPLTRAEHHRLQQALLQRQ